MLEQEVVEAVQHKQEAVLLGQVVMAVMVEMEQQLQ
jgi:hypothetical protein